METNLARSAMTDEMLSISNTVGYAAHLLDTYSAAWGLTEREERNIRERLLAMEALASSIRRELY